MNEHVVSEALVWVLESQAMIFADPVPPEEIETPEESLVGAEITFDGDARGHLELLTTEALAMTLAVNGLGLEPDEPDAVTFSRDALCELVNVALGRVLTDVCGETAVFDLSPPVSLEGVSSERWNHVASRDGAVLFDSDEGPIVMSVRFDTVPAVPQGEGS